MENLRKTWFRLLIVVLILVLINVIFVTTLNLSNLRTNSVRGLQAVATIFAIVSTISLMLFSNYVHDMRKKYLEQARKAKSMLYDFYDKFSSSDDPAISAIVNRHIKPTLEKSLEEWLIIDNVKSWAGGIQMYSKVLREKHNNILIRYLLPIEDEMCELGILYVRNICTTVYTKTITGSFYLIVVGMCVLGLSHILPNNVVYDFFVFNIAVSIIVFSIMELLLLLYWLNQSGRAELVD